MMFKKMILLTFCCVVSTVFAQAELLAQEKPSKTVNLTLKEDILSPAQLQEDLVFLKNSIAMVHPEVGYTADLDQLTRVYKELEIAFQKPMSKDAAWREMARLNPYFADAHLLVVYANSRAEAEAHLAKGQGFFPFEVYVENSSESAPTLFIRGMLDGSSSALAGSQIERINGVPATTIVKELLQRMGGDTPAFRANLLSRRFWMPYIKTYGAPASFELALRRNGTATTINSQATKTLPKSLLEGTNFDQQFQFELLNRQTALLTIKNFMWEHDEKAFFEFTKNAFMQIAENKISNLIIDIRANTGGNDNFWKDGILRYIADKNYRNGSSYRKRVLAGRQSGTEKVGDIVDGSVDSWVQPDLQNPYFFKGNTYLLVGRMTYSSSVLLSNVAQDFGFAKLVGETGYVRSRQTGGINQVNTLPNSKLEIVVPRFILDRPSGKRDPVLIQPDIVLPDNPFDERGLIHALLGKLPEN
nr:S41 family peptidase [uncultured Undibacterium sp.]